MILQSRSLMLLARRFLHLYKAIKSQFLVCGAIQMIADFFFHAHMIKVLEVGT